MYKQPWFIVVVCCCVVILVAAVGVGVIAGGKVNQPQSPEDVAVLELGEQHDLMGLEYQVPVGWQESTPNGAVKQREYKNASGTAGMLVYYVGRSGHLYDDEAERYVKDTLEEAQIQSCEEMALSQGKNQLTCRSYILRATTEYENGEPMYVKAAYVLADATVFAVFVIGQDQHEIEKYANTILDGFSFSAYANESGPEKIEAVYSGVKAAGTKIDDDAAFDVSASLEDGTEVMVNDWHVANPGKLKAGKTSSFKVVRGKLSDTVTIKCP